jgi:hypothetical protein
VTVNGAPASTIQLNKFRLTTNVYATVSVGPCQAIGLQTTLTDTGSPARRLPSGGGGYFYVSVRVRREQSPYDHRQEWLRA